MVDVLDNLRSTLGQTARGAWEGQEGARNALESALEDNADEIENCFDTPRAAACLEQVFEDEDLGSDLQGEWDGSDFADIIQSLRQVQQDWSQQARDAVATVADNNNLSQLHRWCTSGRVDDVREELNATNFSEELQSEYGFSSPSTARQCLQAVSLIQDVRDDLQEAWETAA